MDIESLEPPVTLRARVNEALYGRSSRHPYYIVAPRYVRTSAGIRALYILCNALNVFGEEAYIVIDRATWIDQIADIPLRAPHLTKFIAESHYASGLTPIVIYSETANCDLQAGISVRYILNYVGLLNGPKTLPRSDLTIAYSENLAKTLPKSDMTLYIPVSDPNYWIPDPSAVRKGRLVYAGKYTDFHGHEIPPELKAGSTVITRDKKDSQTREELRRLFQTSEALYVFENTAVATEAALCGCPVVWTMGDTLHEAIAGEELGSDGFTDSRSDDALADAASRVPAFRDRYLSSVLDFETHLHTFIQITKAAAAARPYDQMVELPSIPILDALDAVHRHARRLTISVIEIGLIETLARAWRGRIRLLFKAFPSHRDQ